VTSLTAVQAPCSCRCYRRSRRRRRWLDFEDVRRRDGRPRTCPDMRSCRAIVYLIVMRQEPMALHAQRPFRANFRLD
jgi:hypothetical protein